MNGLDLRDERAMVFDLHDTLHAQRNFMSIGFNAEARGWQAVRMLTGDFGALCAGFAKASGFTLASVTGLPAFLFYRLVAGL